MKNIILVFCIFSQFLFAKEELNVDFFVGHDVYGVMKVDRTDISENFSEFSPNIKTSMSYKVYKSMFLVGNIQYETYHMEADNNEFKVNSTYNLIPYTIGIRYMDEKKKDINTYITLSFGANILLNEGDFPIDKRVNGLAEMDFGILYKKKYFAELDYKHHAFAYEKRWPTFSSYWNGKIVSLNLGYRLK